MIFGITNYNYKKKLIQIRRKLMVSLFLEMVSWIVGMRGKINQTPGKKCHTYSQ